MNKPVKAFALSRILKPKMPPQTRVPTLKDLFYCLCALFLLLGYMLGTSTGSDNIIEVVESVVFPLCTPFLCYDFYQWCKTSRPATQASKP